MNDELQRRYLTGLSLCLEELCRRFHPISVPDVEALHASIKLLRKLRRDLGGDCTMDDLQDALLGSNRETAGGL